MYTTFVAEQWGIFVLTFFYTLAWARGAWRVCATHVYRKNVSSVLAGTGCGAGDLCYRKEAVEVPNMHGRKEPAKEEAVPN